MTEGEFWGCMNSLMALIARVAWTCILVGFILMILAAILGVLGVGMLRPDLMLDGLLK